MVTQQYSWERKEWVREIVNHGGAYPGEDCQALPGQLQQDGRQWRDPSNQASGKSTKAREWNLFEVLNVYL